MARIRWRKTWLLLLIVFFGIPLGVVVAARSPWLIQRLLSYALRDSGVDVLQVSGIGASLQGVQLESAHLAFQVSGASAALRLSNLAVSRGFLSTQESPIQIGEMQLEMVSGKGDADPPQTTGSSTAAALLPLEVGKALIRWREQNAATQIGFQGSLKTSKHSLNIGTGSLLLFESPGQALRLVLDQGATFSGVPEKIPGKIVAEPFSLRLPEVYQLANRGSLQALLLKVSELEYSTGTMQLVANGESSFTLGTENQPITVSASIKCRLESQANSKSGCSYQFGLETLSRPWFMLQSLRVDGALNLGQQDNYEATLKLEELHVGVPLRDLSAVVSGTVGQRNALRIAGAKASVLGGQLSLGPTEIVAGRTQQGIEVRLDQLSLKELFGLYPSAQVEGEGALDVRARLDVSPDGRFSIHEGSFQSKGPGQLKVNLGDSSENKELNFASRALRDFRYTSLHGTLEMSLGGDVRIATSIEGESASLNKGQVVRVNLTLEENLPQLLNSLRLAQGKFGS